VNSGNSLCADEFDWTTVSAAQFDQWTCNSGTNQEFSFVPTVAGGGTYYIQPMTPDYCLDVNGASSASGAAVIQYPCNYASNQQFTLHSVSSGKYEVVAVNLRLVPRPGRRLHGERRSSRPGRLLHHGDRRLGHHNLGA